MSVKEIISKMRRSFFIIYGGFNIGMCIFLLTLARRGVFVSDVLGILVLSLLSCLSYFVFYSKNDLMGKQMFIRVGFNFAVNLVLLLTGATHFGWIVWRMPGDWILFTLIFIVVYVAVLYRELYEVRKLTDEINQKLQERKMRNRAEKNGNNY